MIRSLKGKLVVQVVAGKPGKGFPANLVASAERRLRAIDNAVELDDLRSPPGNRLHALDKDRRGSMRSGSIANGASAFVGPTQAPKMSKLSTTTRASRHAKSER
jgi:plasmid maintenance system killer protein